MAQIPRMTRKLAREIVKKALKSVADFQESADIEQFTFQHFQDYHKYIILGRLKLETNLTKGGRSYYDIVLNSNSISEWPTVKECVDYIYGQYTRRSSETAKIIL